MSLDVFNQVLGLVRVERDAYARCTCSSRTTSSVDVGFGFLRGLDLNNKVDVRNVETSGSYIGGTENPELAFLKPLHGHFTLVLRDVSVHYLYVLFDLIRQDECVAVSLGLSEDNRFAIDASVANQNISQRGNSVLEWATDSQVLHVPCGLVLQILAQVDNSEVLLHVLLRHVSYPPRNCC